MVEDRSSYNRSACVDDGSREFAGNRRPGIARNCAVNCGFQHIQSHISQRTDNTGDHHTEERLCFFNATDTMDVQVDVQIDELSTLDLIGMTSTFEVFLAIIPGTDTEGLVFYR